MNEPQAILTYLGCPRRPPGIRALNQLIRATIQKVPWESVFRIVKRAKTPELALRPRWPEEFWQDAMRLGGGGTCYENNYAFFYLLQSLGYSGYLTVNDMGDQHGCHAAVVIQLSSQKYLVDVSIPLLEALPIRPGQITRRSTRLHTYTLQPAGLNCYQVLRSRHPKPNIFTLLDTPVSEAAYRQVVTRDYGENGLFLDKVILVKIIGQQLWHFSSSELPYRLEWFGEKDHGSLPVPPEEQVQMIANRFQMDPGMVAAAFKALKEG
jgi:hypothetical protein